MSITKRVLLIEPDAAFRGILIDQLSMDAEFVVTGITTDKDILTLDLSSAFDLILLSANIPGTTIAALCQRLREKNQRAPIILLTDAGRVLDAEEEDDIADRVTKPFRILTLLTRMRAQLRQHDQSGHAKIEIGPYAFHSADRQLLDPTTGRVIQLTEKEARILTYLHRAGDPPVARETLLAEVWGYNAGVTTHTLETHIYRLRQKIERDPANARILLTDQGGYRLRA